MILLKGIGYRITFRYMSEHEAVKLLRNADLIKNGEHYSIWFLFIVYKRWAKKL